jgi:hypothetical protein
VKAVTDWQRIHQRPARFHCSSEEGPAPAETEVVVAHVRPL